jgi:transcription elongation factor GreA
VELAGEEETFLLGSREVSGDTDLDVYSEKSPLGTAILGRKIGDAVSYTAPNGKQIPVVIVAARRFGA